MLLKSIKTKQGVSLQPYKVYPYHSLKASISRLVSRPGFLEDCDSTRVPSSFLGDIYDGCVWGEFNSVFLGAPYCYLLTLNVDWFQPFERDVYSLGAIYLTIQNLPRNIRYKPENIILVGIMPVRYTAIDSMHELVLSYSWELSHATSVLKSSALTLGSLVTILALIGRTGHIDQDSFIGSMFRRY